MKNQLKNKIPILIILVLGTAMLLWYSHSGPTPPPPPVAQSFTDSVNKMANEPFNPGLYEELKSTLEMNATQFPNQSSQWKDDMETLNLNYAKSLVYSFNQTINDCGTADDALLQELNRMKSICTLCKLDPYADAYRLYKSVTESYSQLNPILEGKYQPAADRIASQLSSANNNALLQNCPTILTTYSNYYDRLSRFHDFHQKFMGLYDELQSTASAFENWELQNYGFKSGEYDGATEQACLNIWDKTQDQLDYYLYYHHWYYKVIRPKYISQ